MAQRKLRPFRGLVGFAPGSQGISIAFNTFLGLWLLGWRYRKGSKEAGALDAWGLRLWLELGRARIVLREFSWG